jgi:LPS export ABC transporter protein LptC
MRVRLRRLVIALILLSLGTGSALLVRELWSQRKNDLAREALDMLPRVAQRIRDFHRVKVDGGRKVWEVSAKEAQYYQEDKMVAVEEPRVSVFLKDGRMVALSGTTGKVFLDDRDLSRVELEGAIDVQLGEYALRAQKASYERDRDLIVAPGPVEIHGSDFDLHGTSLEIQVASQQLTVSEGVQTVFRPHA